MPALPSSLGLPRTASALARRSARCTRPRCSPRLARCSSRVSSTSPFVHAVEDDEQDDRWASSSSSSSSSSAASATPGEDPLARYNELVQAGTLLNDDHQRGIIGQLQELHDSLANYRPPPIPDEVPKGVAGGGFLSQLFRPGWSTRSSPSSAAASDPAEDSRGSTTLTIPSNAPKGLYLYGTVGTGKSMLMDLFHSTLPSHFHESRRRVHFHAFMIDVHKRNHAYKIKLGENGDRLGEVARDLAREARVLSFDEFQVTDITDAMILRNLLERLMGYGVVCVLTSNRAPDELYKNGLQRGSFLPCIDLIKERFEVMDLNGEDYRKVPGAVKKVYFSSTSPSDVREFRKMFESLASNLDIVQGRPIDVWGRKLVVPESTESVAWFAFDDLCARNLGAADYLEVTKKFSTIFVENAPQLDLDVKDKARRFITFIDACYESRTKLFVSSPVQVTSIFSDKSSEGSHIPDDARGMMDDLALGAGQSSIFTGEEEVFAFKRCVSRLTEMGGERWATFSSPGGQ